MGVSPLLILSRKTDESIIVGDEITITVLGVKGKQVSIGITAPPEVGVHRDEIYQRIQAGESVDEVLCSPEPDGNQA